MLTYDIDTLRSLLAALTAGWEECEKAGVSPLCIGNRGAHEQLKELFDNGDGSVPRDLFEPAVYYKVEGEVFYKGTQENSPDTINIALVDIEEQLARFQAQHPDAYEISLRVESRRSYSHNSDGDGIDGSFIEEVGFMGFVNKDPALIEKEKYEYLELFEVRGGAALELWKFYTKLRDLEEQKELEADKEYQDYLRLKSKFENKD